MTGPSHRFENIDVLRGIAALLVIWLHVAEVFVTLPAIAARGTGWYDAADLLGVGRAGVIAFFAISGYVIVPTVKGPRTDATVDFLIKRLFRLYPPFWLSMALAAWALWARFDKPLSPGIVAANATMVPLEWGSVQMMGHYWTLEVELIFYGLVLALFWTGHLPRAKSIAVLLTVLSIAWPLLGKSGAGRTLVDRNQVWSFLSYFLSVMFWGAMMRARRDAASRDDAAGPAPGGRVPLLLVTALVFGRPLLALAFGSPTVNQEDWRGTLLGLLLFLLFTRIPAQHAKPFVSLGTISYSLYLLHPVVFYPIFHAVAAREAWQHEPLVVYIALSTIGSIVVAGISYRLVEAPANRVARTIVATRNRSIDPSAVRRSPS